MQYDMRKRVKSVVAENDTALQLLQRRAKKMLCCIRQLGRASRSANQLQSTNRFQQCKACLVIAGGCPQGMTA